jgi:pheromone shutdown protein TraB
VYVNQAILAAMTKNETIMTEIQNTFWNQELFEVILDKRNEIIADEIIHSPHTEIFATYWALHFKWIFEILQNNDSNWKIVSKKQFLPFQ